MRLFQKQKISQKKLEIIATNFAAELQNGDIVTLKGQIGAGKSLFARKIIQALHYNSEIPQYIPSPTFNILQKYHTHIYNIAHYDLYRIKEYHEIEILGFFNEPEYIKIVEWPEILEQQYQQNNDNNVFEVIIDIYSQKLRNLTIIAKNFDNFRLKRFILLENMLEKLKLQQYKRISIQADASNRKYYRIIRSKNKNLIIMSDETAIDKNYLLENNHKIKFKNTTIPSFCAMAKYLQKQGFNVPHIYHVDNINMFMIIQDFGEKKFPPQKISSTKSHKPYQIAIDFLLELAVKNINQQNLNIKIQMQNCITKKYFTIKHKPQILNAKLLAEELQQFTKWYYPYVNKTQIKPPLEKEFQQLWKPYLKEIDENNKTIALRDFHSPNMFWLHNEKNIRKIAIIDFQDACWAHLALDLVSLLQDARYDVPQQLQNELLQYYIKKAEKLWQDFNERKFIYHYMIIGAQRNSRILGTFVKIAQTQGKKQYLKHLQRVWEYNIKSLEHHKLVKIKNFYLDNINVAK